MAKLLRDLIHDSELWLSAFVQLFTYMLKHPRDLKAHKVTKETFVELYGLCKTKSEAFNTLVPTVEFNLLRLGLKYLSLEMIDEAIYVAFKCDI